MGVRDAIHTRILRRDYGPGARLPRDEELAGEFGCARTTVQRAMRDLQDRGLIERRRKGGTWVRHHPLTRATFEIPVIRQEVEEKGCTYGYQLVHQAVAMPPLEVQANFGNWPTEPMLQVQALHLADHRPYMYEDRWLCLQTVPALGTVDLSRQSANEWLVHHQHYDRCDLRLYAHKVTAHEAGLMGVASAEAVLVLERTTWIESRLITSVRTLTRPDYQLLATT